MPFFNVDMSYVGVLTMFLQCSVPCLTEFQVMVIRCCRRRLLLSNKLFYLKKVHASFLSQHKTYATICWYTSAKLSKLIIFSPKLIVLTGE